MTQDQCKEGWTEKDPDYFETGELVEITRHFVNLCSDDKHKACLLLGHCLRIPGYSHRKTAVLKCRRVKMRVRIEMEDADVPRES